MQKAICMVVATFVVLLSLTACAETQPSDSLPSSTTVSSPGEVVPDSASSEVAPPSLSSAMNTLLSLHIEQREAYGLLRWELDISEVEELEILEGLLSTEGLSPLEKGDPIWPEGGIGIGFELRYSDGTIEGACNPKAKVRSQNNRSTLCMDDIYYAYPEETGDKLLAFLVSKGVTVV